MPLPLPKFLQVEPVGQCNLRCQMCPILFRRDGPPHGPPAFMDFDLFARLLGQFPELEELLEERLTLLRESRGEKPRRKRTA